MTNTPALDRLFGFVADEAVDVRAWGLEEAREELRSAIAAAYRAGQERGIERAAAACDAIGHEYAKAESAAQERRESLLADLRREQLNACTHVGNAIRALAIEERAQ